MKQEVLLAHDAQKLISKTVAVPQSQLVKKASDITLKTPLVLKIIAEQAVHKTEIGGIKVVMHASELSEAFEELLAVAKKHKLKLEGIMAQEFIEGTQLIIGLKRDPVFGHVILFGLGGILTELMDDTAVRKCPISMRDAEDMLKELKAHKLFEGFRNIKLNTQLLKETLVAVSKLPQKHKDITELDINPFILNAKDGYAVDVRIIKEK